MRALTILCLLQTALLIAVFLELPDKRPADHESHAASETQSMRAVSNPFARPVARPAAAGINEQDLRRVIREELQRLADEGHIRTVAVSDIDKTSTRDPVEQRELREHVNRQLEYYKSLGSVSPRQMSQLQRDIARLDSSGRQQMLSELVRAMNAREIDGLF